MFFLLFVVLFILLTAVNRAAFGRQIRITDVFNAGWCFAAGATSAGVLGFDPTGTEVCVMAIVTVAVLNFVYILLCKCDKDLAAPTSYDRRSFEPTVQYPILIAVHLACYLYCFPYLRSSLSILASGGFKALRAVAYVASDELAASTGELLLFQWVVSPVFSATILITVVSLVLGQKKSWPLLLIMALDVAVYTLIFGGRGHLVKIISFSAIALLFFEGRRLMVFLYARRRLLLMVLAAFLLMAGLTVRRSLAGMNIIENIYSYYTGGFVYLDKILEAHPVGEYYLWGQATLGFLVCVFWMVAKIFFGVDYAAADHRITQLTSVYYMISPTTRLNAVTTMMYPFLADFGYAGLIIGPAVYAVIVMLAERHFKKHGTLSSLCVMVFVFHTLLLSTLNYSFYKPDTLFIILFTMLFTSKISLRSGVLTLTPATSAVRTADRIE